MKQQNHPSFQQKSYTPNTLSSKNDSCAQCTSNCPNFNLCEKRIFIIGGVERMEALYRDLVEKNGGFLDYHSGSMQGGTKKIEKCLQRADVIICPINCNSHGACVKVKNLAKKFDKNFHMLPTGSLSMIKRLLQESYA